MTLLVLIYVAFLGAFTGFGAHLQAESGGYRGVLWSGLLVVVTFGVALFGIDGATADFRIGRNPMTMVAAAVAPLMLVFIGCVIGAVFAGRVHAATVGLRAGVSTSLAIIGLAAAYAGAG